MAKVPPMMGGSGNPLSSPMMELKLPVKETKSSLSLKGGDMFPKLLVPKEQLTLTGPSGSNFVSEDGKDIGVETFKRDTTLFAERLKVRSFRNSLVRIKGM
ncbi:hypothetical protein SLA2020_425390 [Shorea laevis]